MIDPMMKFTNEMVAERLLALIENAKVVDETGKVSFQADFRFSGWQILLEASLQFHSEVPEIERKRIVWRSLNDAGTIGTIEKGTFLQQSTKNQSAYLSRPPQRYVLLTEISMQADNTLPGGRLGQTTVAFPKSIPPAFNSARSKMMDLASASLFGKPPTNYKWVRVSTWARSIDAAATISLDSLNLLRGIWNLFVNLSPQGQNRQTISGPREPVNSIVLGPLHTVHLPSGRIEGDVWWYEPDYCGSIRPLTLGQHSGELGKFVRYVRKKLSLVPYREQLEEMIRQYGHALDGRDWNSSFLHLWQVLESTTDTIQEKYAVTVKRAAFVNTEYEFHQSLLDGLRVMRNRLVHSGERTPAIEYHLFRLKTYVENLLLFHLNFAGTFPSLKHVGEFLSLPPDLVELRRKVIIYRKGIDFRT